MLSYLYRLAHQFEQRHHVRANLLYLNPEHLHQLRQSFADPADLNRILALLEMELVIDSEVVHPHLARTATRQWGVG